MAKIPIREDNMSSDLYEAAVEGNVETLERLMQNDRLILQKVSLTSFNETPLHVSALMGHLDFTNIIIKLCPKMATELDSSKCSPLHLASAEGHSEVVKALLQANNDVCLCRDEDDRIPLHLAAIRGRIEVMKELVSARLESVHLLSDGDTVFHLCVRYNHLEALEMLVEMVDDEELVRVGNQEGNTILHLAVMLKQVKTIKYLLSIPKIKASANTKSKIGLTVFEVLDQYPCRNFRISEIRDLLIKVGLGSAQPSKHIVCSTCEIKAGLGSSQPPKHIVSSTSKMSCFRKFLRFLDYDQFDWVEKSRGSLMVVATVIATMSFQVAVSPPGGFWQEDYTNKMASYNCSSVDVCGAGTAILSYVYKDEFLKFTIVNTIAFIASLTVIFITIIGFPLQNKYLVWFLTLAMGTAVTFMAATYQISMDMISPREFSLFDWYNLGLGSLFYWLGLLCLVGGLHVMRLLYWIGKDVDKFLQPMKFVRKFKLKRQPQKRLPSVSA